MTTPPVRRPVPKLAGIGTVFAAPAAPTSPPTAEEPTPPADVPEAPAPEKPKRPRRPRAQKPDAAPAADRRSADVDPSPFVGFQVAPGTRTTLKAVRQADPRYSYTALILRAVQAEQAALKVHFASEPDGEGGLFQGVRPIRRPVRDEAWVGMSVRMAPGDLAILDQLVEEAGAPSRSQYIDAALQAHYAPKTKPERATRANPPRET